MNLNKKKIEFNVNCKNKKYIEKLIARINNSIMMKIVF